LVGFERTRQVLDRREVTLDRCGHTLREGGFFRRGDVGLQLLRLALASGRSPVPDVPLQAHAADTVGFPLVLNEVERRAAEATPPEGGDLRLRLRAGDLLLRGDAIARFRELLVIVNAPQGREM